MSEGPDAKSRPSSNRGLAFFEKGNEAALRNNFDYAVEMYLKAINEEPGNLKYRQALRLLHRKRFGNDPAKVGWGAAKVKMAARPWIIAAKSRGKWVEVLERCEDAFLHHPWDVHVARDAADAAERLKMPVLARWYLESVFQQAGKDAQFYRHLARVYELNQMWDTAIRCWEKVHELAPADEEAGRQIKSLTANATITRSGLDEAVRTAPASGAGPEAAPPDVEELKRQAMTPEQRLRQQIRDEPTRVGPYLELADLYKGQNRLEEAEKVLAAGRRATGGDAVVVEAHADVQIARLRRAQAAYARKVREQPHDLNAKDKLDKITAILQDYELREYQRRAESRPEDLATRFQLGVRLARAGRTDEAIAEFQHARGANTSKLRGEALYQLGRCFEAKGLPKLAERNYQEALELAEDDADRAKIKELHYALGCVYENAGDFKSAEEHFNEVAASDYTYKDVAQRLENLNRQV